MMSGGVDSSVAAAVLREQGHDVTGVTLKLWGGESDSGCCSAADVEDARRVAAQLDIPHYVFNFADEFDADVVTPYIDSYAAGETPNPCVECNRTMKFGRVLNRALQLGYDDVATGHHARVVDSPHGRAIARGADPAKDQSYVLYMLDAEQLARIRLPIGEMTKAEVRARAHELGLRTAAKQESMDVCFITRGGRRAFLGARIERRPGSIVDTGGREHRRARRCGALHDRAAPRHRRRPGRAALRGRHRTRDRDGHRRSAGRLAAGPGAAARPHLRPGSGRRGTRADARPRRTVCRAARRRHAGVRATSDRVAPGQVVACYDGELLLGGGIAAA